MPGLGLANTRRVGIPSSLSRTPTSHPSMFASRCMSLSWADFSLLVGEAWAQPSQLVTAVEESSAVPRGGRRMSAQARG